jgi:hypothetical protein
MLQLGWLLRGCTPGLVLLEVLAKVRLRLRLRCELLLLRRNVVLRVVLWRVSLALLRTLLLLLLVVDWLRL